MNKPPAKVNNFKVNKPIVCKSRNIEPVIYIEKREVEDVKQIVNAKVADEKLIHKPKKKDATISIPVIKNSAGRGSRRGSKK